MQTNGKRVAYSGTKGAYAEMAASKIFQGCELVPYSDFDSAYNSVGVECDYAVLPIENSYAGEVARVGDLAFEGDKYICGVYAMAIRHCLLGTKGTTIDSIKKVYSHQQALMQCDKFIRNNGFEISESTNTALSAKNAAEINDTSIGVIASKRAGELYGLEVIVEDVNEKSMNTTRFAVFSNTPSETHGNFILFFTLKNEAGSLGNATSAIGKFGFNMRSLRSRPTKENNWEYYFYVEGEGHLESENGKAMIELLKKYCLNLKIVGTYEKEIQI